MNPNYVEAYCNRGIAYSDLKEYERAIQDFDKTVELNPNYAKAYFNRGIVCIESKVKKYEQALQDFDKVIEINPNSANAYFYRAMTYFILEDYVGYFLMSYLLDKRKVGYKKRKSLGNFLCMG